MKFLQKKILTAVAASVVLVSGFNYGSTLLLPYEKEVSEILSDISYDNGIAAVIAQSSNMDAAFETVGDVAESLGKPFSAPVDVPLISNNYEPFRNKNGDGKKVSHDYTRATAFYANKQKDAVCMIIMGDRMHSHVTNGRLTNQLRLTLAHEATHCPMFYLSDNRRSELEQLAPGLKLFTNAQVQGIANKRNAKIALKYREHVMEIIADLNSVMYLKDKLSSEDFDNLMESLADRRSKANYKKMPNAVGHFTYPYISELQKKPELFDQYADLYKQDQIAAIVKMGYDMGKNYSFTYAAFQKRFGHLDYSIPLIDNR